MNRGKDIYDPMNFSKSIGRIDESGTIRDSLGMDTKMKVDPFGNVVKKMFDEPTGYRIDALGCLRKNPDYFRRIF